MAINLNTTLTSLNEAIFPSPNTSTVEKLSDFGGESFGFSADVQNSAAKFFYSQKALPSGYTVAKGMLDTPIPRAIANNYALFNFRGLYGGTAGSVNQNYIDNPNNGLMGGQDAQKVSVSKILQFYSERYPHIAYKPADFVYAKYYKKIPVNHLITLRRFPLPVQDNIFDLRIQPGAKGKDTKTVPDEVDGTQVSGVTAITYLGETAGNKIEEIFNFQFGLNWTEQTGEMKEYESGDPGYTGQPFYSKIGPIGRALADTAKGVSSEEKFRKQINQTSDPFGTTYANFVLGPINVINKTNIRDRGLKFTNDFKLTFEYELRSLNYVNPKIAMIDIISNMLTMTTNNAQFFGGGHRYYGSAGYVSSQFGNINLLKAGNFSGYLGSVVSDVEKGFSNVFGGSGGGFNFQDITKGGLQGLLTAGKTLLGNILGGFLGKEVGALSGTQATQALISGEPTGSWHVTIGNPLNPIGVMGNMYCENSTMTLGKGLGYDDFPMEVKFEIDLKHGKPRDKGDIENIFNAGRGRIYASAANENDINNLRGADEPYPYGAVKAGNSSLQPTQSSNGVATSSISNDKVNTTSSNSSPSTFGAYISALTASIIDS